VIGDKPATGDKPQYDIGRKLEEYRQARQLHVLRSWLATKHLRLPNDPQDFQKKFEMPYKLLLDAGVKFLRGARQPRRSQPALLQAVSTWTASGFYTFTKGAIDFLRSGFELHGSQAAGLVRGAPSRTRNRPGRWRTSTIPLYSSGANGTVPKTICAPLLEPLFVKYGMDRPCLPATSISTEARQTTEGDLLLHVRRVREAPQRETFRRDRSSRKKGDDIDNTFMVVEVAGDVFNFQEPFHAEGTTIDSGRYPIGRTAKSPNRTYQRVTCAGSGNGASCLALVGSRIRPPHPNRLGCYPASR